jgi:hypothetical protein
MTNCPDDSPLADDIPAADAAEQRQPAADSAEDAGLDPRCVADLLQRDANPSDVIDQAIIVPLPDDDPDTDVTVLSTGNVVVAAKQHAAAWPGPLDLPTLNGVWRGFVMSSRGAGRCRGETHVSGWGLPRR